MHFAFLLGDWGKFSSFFLFCVCYINVNKSSTLYISFPTRVALEFWGYAVVLNRKRKEVCMEHMLQKVLFQRKPCLPVFLRLRHLHMPGTWLPDEGPELAWSGPLAFSGALYDLTGSRQRLDMTRPGYPPLYKAHLNSWEKRLESVFNFIKKWKFCKKSVLVRAG